MLGPGFALNSINLPPREQKAEIGQGCNLSLLYITVICTPDTEVQVLTMPVDDTL